MAHEESITMAYLYETHLHTDEGSSCGKTPAREYVPFYIDHGYQGIIVTDHFHGSVSYLPDRSAPWKEQVDHYCRGYEEALNEGIKRGLDVFFGIEQAFNRDEALIYGVDKQWLYDHPEIRTWNRSEIFNAVDAAGGVVVHAHPFRVRTYLEKIILSSNVHAVEAFNPGNTPEADLYAVLFARKYGFPMTSGSDMHRCGAQTDDQLFGVYSETRWESVMDYVNALRGGVQLGLKYSEGRDQGEYPPLALPWEYRDRMDRVVDWDPSILFEEGQIR